MVRAIPNEVGTKYYQRLDKEVIGNVEEGPARERACTDIACMVLFVITLIVFVVFFIYFVVNGGANLSQLTGQYSVETSKGSFGATFAKTSGTIVGMIFLSATLSMIFIILCAKFPKCVVYTAIITTFVIYLALIVLGIIMHVWALTVVFIIVAALNACLLYCWRDQIRIGIVLLGASGTFMMERKMVLVIGLISLLINIVFLVFFCLGWISAWSQTLPQFNNSQSSRSSFNSMMIFYIFMAIYISYFLYYLMVYVLSTAVTYWYYQLQKPILYGYRTASKHVGTMALASLIITIIVVLRRIVQHQFQASENFCMKAIWCFVACIMSCIEGFVEILNHNLIIVTAVTGENYFGAAKTALGLIAGNFGLFVIVDFIVDFIQFYSLVVCVFIPAILGGGLIWRAENDENRAVIGGFATFLLSWIVVSVILGLLYEVVSSIYILYCFDKKLRSRGHRNGQLPKIITDLFQEAQVHETFSIVHQQNAQKAPTSTNLKQNKHMDSDPDVSSQTKTPRRRKLKKQQEQRKMKEIQKLSDKSEEIAPSQHPIEKMKQKDEFDDYDKNSPPQKMHPFYAQQNDIKY